MDASKMSRSQLAKFVADGKKHKLDDKRWKALQKEKQDLAKGGKSLGQIATQNPTV